MPGWATRAGSTRSLEQRRSSRRFERERAALAVVADCGFGCLPPPRPPHGRDSLSSASAITRSLLQDRHLWLHKQWRRGAWDRLESLLRATASATPPSLVALSSSPSRGVAKTVAAMGAGLSAWPPGMQILCSVSDMTGAMPQPRRDTFTEFPARGHRGMIVRYPTAVMARSGGSSLRQLVGSPRHTEEHQSMRCRSCHSSTSTATPSSLT